MTVALACCMLITLASLLYIFAVDVGVNLTAQNTRATYLRERKDAVYGNLRDLNFEYRAGKISEADYRSLKTSLQDEAATLLAELGRLDGRAVRRKGKPSTEGKRVSADCGSVFPAGGDEGLRSRGRRVKPDSALF